MLRALKRIHDGKPKPRRVSVFAGDFNTSIDTILLANRIRQKTPAFALLDMRTSECHWNTVRKIATHKPKGLKIEILYFLATGWLGRALSTRGDEAEADLWWGNNSWKPLVEASASHVTWAETMANRFQTEFGYRYAHPWPIHASNESSRVFYYLVHATDHPAAPSLMKAAYRFACGGRAGTLADDQMQLL